MIYIPMTQSKRARRIQEVENNQQYDSPEEGNEPKERRLTLFFKIFS